MKTHFHKIISMALLGLALYAQGTPAWAGQAHASTVSIFYKGTVPISAQGTLTGARYSPDSTQYIGCYSLSDPYGLNASVTCSATTRVGKSVSCYTQDGRFANAIKGLTDSSYISFKIVGTAGNYLCTDMEVINASHLLK